jgi:hypothetical protein
MKCNGCGGEIATLGGTFSYGDVYGPYLDENATQKSVDAEHHRTFCPKCTTVLKDILLNSDLSDHWHKYDFDDQTT